MVNINSNCLVQTFLPPPVAAGQIPEPSRRLAPPTPPPEEITVAQASGLGAFSWVTAGTCITRVRARSRTKTPQERSDLPLPKFQKEPTAGDVSNDESYRASSDLAIA